MEVRKDKKMILINKYQSFANVMVIFFKKNFAMSLFCSTFATAFRKKTIFLNSSVG